MAAPTTAPVEATPNFADYRLPAPYLAATVPWCGAAVMLAALWLFWRSHADLGWHWSATLEVREGHALVDRGVYRRVRHPMYAGSPYSFFMLEAAAVSTGIAAGALAAYGDLMAEKQTPIPPFGPRLQDPDYQRWYGTAAGKVATADAAWRHCAQQWTRAAGEKAFTPELDMQLVRISAEVVKLNWDAVAENCVRTAGSTSVRTGQRIERVWRDLSTVHAHNGIVFFGELAARALAQAHFAAAQ